MKVQFDPAKRIYGVLYATTTALCWGFLAIIIKVALNFVDPFVIVWFRFGISFIILFSYFIIWDRPKLSILIKPPVLLIIAALGLLVNYIGFAFGVDYTSPGNAQIFIQLGPLILAMVGIIFYQERLSKRQFAGFIVAGLGLIFFYGDQAVGSDLYLKGVLWLILSAIAWAAYASLQKKLVLSNNAQQLNLVIYGLPVLLMFPVVDLQPFVGYDWIIWLLLISLGINTIVAYGCLAESFKYLEANKISVIISLNPIITFVIMIILERMHVTWIKAETLTIYGYAGAMLVLGGAVMVVMPKKLIKIQSRKKQ